MWEPKGRNELLLKRHSPWQEIRLYKNGPHYWMALNGVLQFHTAECYMSHQYMCRIPVEAAKNPQKALVIGGGDGFAARELLNYPQVKEITNVELDGDLVGITKKHPIMQVLTDNSFNHPRVNVVVGDGIGYLLNSKSKYDIIIDDCEYEYTNQKNDREAKAEKDRYDAYLKSLVTKLNPGGICCIMEPLIRVKPPVSRNLANTLIRKNRFFFDTEGRVLDHIRYSPDELKSKLINRHMQDNEDLEFFMKHTPFVTYEIFMSRMIGPEAYIYASNEPIRPRRKLPAPPKKKGWI